MEFYRFINRLREFIEIWFLVCWILNLTHTETVSEFFNTKNGLFLNMKRHVKRICRIVENIKGGSKIIVKLIIVNKKFFPTHNFDGNSKTHHSFLLFSTNALESKWTDEKWMKNILVRVTSRTILANDESQRDDKVSISIIPHSVHQP